MAISNFFFKIVDWKMLKRACKDSFYKLHPCVQIKNPVMFVTYIGAIISGIVVIQGISSGSFSFFNFQITLWLWFTVFFANFAEAIAEGKGKAQAESLRKSRQDIYARCIRNGNEEKIPACELKKGDVVVCEAGDTIPGDGEVIEGIASVNESAITGESAPVIRESGGDRSAVTGGTKVMSDRIVIKIISEQGKSFLDHLIHLVEGASRKPTPNEVALAILLTSMTIIFLLIVASLKGFVVYSEFCSGIHQTTATLPVLIALLVCLIPTTIGGLLSAIGISGMDRLIRQNVIAMSGKAVEASGDIDVLLLDKTGTITLGDRMAMQFIPVCGHKTEALAKASHIASLSDQTPEGRSVVILAKKQFGLRAVQSTGAKFIPFSAETGMSGVDISIKDQRVSKIRKGSLEAISRFVEREGNCFPSEAKEIAEKIAKQGGTPLAVVEDKNVLGIIALQDVVKHGIRERFSELRRMGIRTIMITGDNPLTAAAIAAEAGVDDFIPQATPEIKLKRIREEQSLGHMVAMIGDGTNDAPALAQADVGVAMNSGTQAAREAGNMIDLDNNPTKLIEVVQTGKQLLMTRGALTTFSIANDVAKYFAILPAMFGTLYATNSFGPLMALGIMNLSSPQSAILSAVIFNALIIIALIPLAIKGVRCQPMDAQSLLKRNLSIYGAGGLIAPFIGIKIIDIILSWLSLV